MREKKSPPGSGSLGRERPGQANPWVALARPGGPRREARPRATRGTPPDGT
jgi:hypothetical protein